MMNIRAVIILSNYRLRKLFSNPRFYIVVAVALSFIYLNATDLKNISVETGVNLTPWLLPFMFSRPYDAAIFGAIIGILFCDAPFTEKSETYLLLRVNRSSWFLGQVLYVISVSLIFTLIITISSIVFLIPRVEFSTEWGRVLDSIAYYYDSSVGKPPFQMPSFYVDYAIVNNFTPLQAMLHSNVMLFLLCCFSASLIFVLNLKTNRFIGAGVIVFLAGYSDFFSGRLSYEAYISPFTWLSITEVDYFEYSLASTPQYAYGFLIIVPILLWTIGYISIIKSDINTLENI